MKARKRGPVKRARIDSTPVRRGDIYCSRRCGYKCKHRDFLDAKLDAEVTASMLGPGWIPRVWDNLGWHWSVTFGKDVTGISISRDKSTGWMLICNFESGMSIVLHSEPDEASPKRLLIMACEQMQDYARIMTCIVQEFPL